MNCLAGIIYYVISSFLHTAALSKCIFQFQSEQSERGNFSSPMFPNNYSESLECIYNFQGKDHETLRLTFHHFDLEAPFKKGCLTDYVDVSTITIVGSKFLVGRFCGNDIPNSMLFMNPRAEIIFKTNHVIHSKGFHGSYHFQDEKMIPPPKSTMNVSNCGGIVTGVGGIIVSPGYPYYFPKNIECIWLLRVDYHMRIYVRIIKMQLYGSIANCPEAELAIYDGYSSISFNPNLMQKYCGDLRYYKNIEEQTALSARNRLLLRFKTSAAQIMKGEDLDKNAVGFKIIWTAVEFQDEGKCKEFVCKDSRYCMSSLDNACSEVRNYCIDKSLVCDGYPNCSNEDYSDEDRCNIPLLAGCGAAGGILLLSFLIGFCLYRRQSNLHEHLSHSHSLNMQLRQLEHSPSYSGRTPFYPDIPPSSIRVDKRSLR
ncbi:CUB domain-containing protein 2-like [Parasteatoda tepidariorum]|uniref:CUB domain-containing protein 2-like n=1 Tax=Parasteatoda tepidariorum TaxID=114398 RepID=UPI001C71DA9D|nr:membrane frizzled-related protein-like [Parasteatoda tepidariorum]